MTRNQQNASLNNSLSHITSPTGNFPESQSNFEKGAQNNPSFYLRQAFSSLSDSFVQNKENGITLGGGGINQSFEGGTSIDFVKLSAKIDDIYTNLCTCIQNHCASKEEVKGMKQELESKVNKEELDVLLLQKANKQSVANALQRKANKQDLSQIEKNLENLDLMGGIQDKIENLQACMEKEMKEKMQIIGNEIKEMKLENEKSLKKILNNQSSQRLQTEINNLQSQFSSFSREMSQESDGNNTSIKDQIKQLQSQIKNIEQYSKQEKKKQRDLFKQSQEEIEKSVSTKFQEFSQKFDQIQKESSQNQPSHIKEVLQSYEQNLEKQISQFNEEMLKLSKETYYELDLIDKEIVKIKNTLKEKSEQSKFSPISSSDYESLRLDVKELKLKFEKINDEVAQKSNIKDVCTLVDIKANIEDVDKSFQDLYQELTQNYALKKAVESTYVDQKFINESLCALNCLGKWVWNGGFTYGSVVKGNVLNNFKNQFKMSAFERISISDTSGMVSTSDYVKWSREIINTCPDNFELSKMEDDSGSILIHTSGIYEINFVFFVPHEVSKPSAQLRINGKPVLSTIDSQYQVPRFPFVFPILLLILILKPRNWQIWTTHLLQNKQKDLYHQGNFEINQQIYNLNNINQTQKIEMSSDSPISNTKKRQASKNVSKLEEELGQAAPASSGLSSKSRNKRDSSQALTESDMKYFESLRDMEALLGPNLCSLCDRTITKSVKVRCLECSNPPIHLCLECHRTGEEKYDHRASHAYYILDNLSFPLFIKNWSAKEELMLIQGIMKCGLGNWIDISEQYVKTKEAKECEDHYFTFYYKTKDDSQPDGKEDVIMRGPKYVKGDQVIIDIDEDKQAKAQRRLKEYQEKRRVEVEEEEKQFAVPSLLPQGDQNQNGNIKNKRRDGLSINAVSEVVGYLPKRGDFDQEYDMDADLLLADMEFFDDDTTEDIQLKNEVIELYNARLDERIRRKKFVIERNILDYKKQQKNERKKTKEEREIINSMKVFARFSTPEDHERLVSSLIKERLLREVIEQLKFFKSRGLNTLDQIEKYIETQKKKQSQSAYAQSYNQTSERSGFNETSEFIKNPSELLSSKAASQLIQNSSLARSKNPNAQISKQAIPSMMSHSGWEKLDNKERELCSENDIEPEDYMHLKQLIQIEATKNKAISQQFVKDKSKDYQSVKEKIPVIYDYWVNVNFIKKASQPQLQ